MKRLIDELEQKYGSMRRAAREVGTSRQNLENWRNGGKNQSFLAVVERIRKTLGISKSKMWALIAEDLREDHE